MSFIYQTSFTSRTYEVDAQGLVSLPFIVGYMQEAAAHHANALGASMEKLRAKGVAWALSRMRLEIFDYVGAGEKIEVHTWPSGWEKFFFYRDYRIFNAKGKLIAQATSTWLMFDINTRKLTSKPDLASNIRPPEGASHLPKSALKIRFPDEVHHSKTFPVNWFDLDINRHVNNIRYFQWLVESLPTKFVEEHTLREIELIFKAEGLLEDIMTVDSHFVDTATCVHRLQNQNGNELILGRTIWDQ
ncbi:MAG: acyl-ACP thioesterase [Bacteroidetes bacterium]|nr:acyl-ACP thioesterase [Bacteroidota bacterium]